MRDSASASLLHRLLKSTVERYRSPKLGSTCEQVKDISTAAVNHPRVCGGPATQPRQAWQTLHRTCSWRTA